MQKSQQPGNRANSGQPAVSDAATQAVTDAVLEAESGQPTVSGAADPNELDQLRRKAAERDEFLGLLQHVRADFANYQKRIQKETENTRRYATQPLVVDLLPAMDNLERALQAADAGSNSASLLDGIRMVHQQLLSAMARHGVQPIAAVGLPFNPEFHEALLEQPSPDKPERTVLQELQKGYSLHDRVIRPAKVVVSTSDSAATKAPAAVEPKTN